MHILLLFHAFYYEVLRIIFTFTPGTYICIYIYFSPLRATRFFPIIRASEDVDQDWRRKEISARRKLRRSRDRLFVVPTSTFPPPPVESKTIVSHTYIKNSKEYSISTRGRSHSFHVRSADLRHDIRVYFILSTTCVLVYIYVVKAVC